MTLTTTPILSVLPPLLVLFIGFITRRVILSLIAGIILASFIATDFNIINTLLITFRYLCGNFKLNIFFSTETFWDSGNLFICLFLLFLGILVTALQHSGGAYAYGHFVKGFLKNKTTVETASLSLSTFLFIDDYFSCLTVGSVMYPLSSKYKIPRVKLAFLVDSMAAPLAILCPFSGWAAAIIGFLRENGISDNLESTPLILVSPLSAYFHVLPFLFYSFILTIGIWFIVINKITFGLMKKHETIATKTGNLLGGQTTKNISISKGYEFEHHPDNTAIIDFFIPLTILLLSIVLSMQTFKNDAAAALFVGGGIALLVSTGFFLIRQKIQVKKIPSLYFEGIKLMLPAILVLLLAWTLGDLLREELNTGEYLANLMLHSINILYLPVMMFFTAFLIAFMIGSAWGTAAMLFPIAIPLVLALEGLTNLQPELEHLPILFPVLGAVLSGCVAGDHLSPISDTTVMSATSTRCRHMDHVKTQLTYALPLVFGTACSFFCIAFLQPLGTLIACFGSLGIGLTVSLLVLYGFHWVSKK